MESGCTFKEVAEATKVKVNPDAECTYETDCETNYDTTVPSLVAGEHAGDEVKHTYTGTILIDAKDMVSNA